MANYRWIIGGGSVTNKWLGFPTQERAGRLGVASLPPPTQSQTKMMLRGGEQYIRNP